MTEPVKVDMWPMGYCDNGGGHFGEHPLYTSSDGSCKNFVTSERLLETQQLFDLTIENELLREENELLREEIEDFYISTTPPKVEFDSWITEEDEFGDPHQEWYSGKDGNITSPIFFQIEKYPSLYRLRKVVQIGYSFASLEEAQKFAEEEC